MGALALAAWQSKVRETKAKEVVTKQRDQVARSAESEKQARLLANAKEQVAQLDAICSRITEALQTDEERSACGELPWRRHSPRLKSSPQGAKGT